MATKRRRKKKSNTYEFLHDWGMIFLIVGGMAAWASMPEGLAEPVGFLLLGAALLLGLSKSFAPKPKGRRR